MKKNNIYRIGGKNYVCLFAGNNTTDGYSCLCPIRPHRKDAGYNINMAKPVIFSNDCDKQHIGQIKKGAYIINLNKKYD
jgi:hypothetical protein